MCTNLIVRVGIGKLVALALHIRRREQHDCMHGASRIQIARPFEDSVSHKAIVENVEILHGGVKDQLRTDHEGPRISPEDVVQDEIADGEARVEAALHEVLGVVDVDDAPTACHHLSGAANDLRAAISDECGVEDATIHIQHRRDTNDILGVVYGTSKSRDMGFTKNKIMFENQQAKTTYSLRSISHALF